MKRRTLASMKGWKKAVAEAVARFPGLAPRGVRLAGASSVPTLKGPVTTMFVADFAAANLWIMPTARLTTAEREAIRAVSLANVARSALREAGRPAGADMRHVAVGCGFKILPRAPRDRDHAYLAKVVAYRYDRDRSVRDRRIALALAAGLLVERGQPFTDADVRYVATLLLAPEAS